MNKCLHTELSSHEGTRSEFNPSKTVIKLGIDVHQEFYVVVCQEGGSNPKPAQRFKKEPFLSWAAQLKEKSGAEIHAVYKACGFGFGLQRRLAAQGIACHVVCPQKLDERNKRVKTDGLDAKALCLKLGRFVEGNQKALAFGAGVERGRGTAPRDPPAAGAAGQSEKTVRSAGAQLDGESQDRAGEKLVEAAQLCRALRA